MTAEASKTVTYCARRRASNQGVRETLRKRWRQTSIASAIVLGLGDWIAGETLALIIGEECVDDVVEVAVEDALQISR